MSILTVTVECRNPLSVAPDSSAITLLTLQKSKEFGAITSRRKVLRDCDYFSPLGLGADWHDQLRWTSLPVHSYLQDCGFSTVCKDIGDCWQLMFLNAPPNSRHSHQPLQHFNNVFKLLYGMKHDSKEFHLLQYCSGIPYFYRLR